MLMKLSPGINLINILRKAFTYADPKSAKKTVGLTIVFALSGSARVKASLQEWPKYGPRAKSDPL